MLLVSLFAGCFRRGRRPPTLFLAERGSRAPLFLWGRPACWRVTDMELITSMAVTRRNSNRQFALEMFEPGLPLTTEKEQMMSTEQYKQSGRISRRKFLRAIGLGIVVSGTSSVLPGRAAHAQYATHRRFVIPEDRFGRLFPQLPTFAAPSAQLEAALLELGKPGGILDAKDALDQGPVLLITEPAPSQNNPNNTTHTAGTTFMGQFMDHDMTFDLTSSLGHPTDPENSTNTRTPAFDLDAVYGACARVAPHALF